MNSAKKDGLFFLHFSFARGRPRYGQYFTSRNEGPEDRDPRAQDPEHEADQQAKEQMKQIDVYKNHRPLEKYQLGIPENEVDFYAWVQQELTKNGVKTTW